MMEQGELYWMLDVFIVAQVNKQKGPLWGPGIMSAASVVNMWVFFHPVFPSQWRTKETSPSNSGQPEFGDVAH